MPITTVTTKIKVNTRGKLQTLAFILKEQQLDIMDRLVEAELNSPKVEKLLKAFNDAQYGRNGKQPAKKVKR